MPRDQRAHGVANAEFAEVVARIAVGDAYAEAGRLGADLPQVAFGVEHERVLNEHGRRGIRLHDGMLEWRLTDLPGLAYALAGLVLWILLRPDPLHLARAHSEANASESTGTDTATTTRTWTPPVVLGATVMVLTQLVMVAIMTMTPIHMQHHGHSVGAAGFVIAVHVAGMYLPSLLSGALVDRFGAGVVGVAAAVTLVAAGVAAALAPPSSIVALALALGLLGRGWNLGLISGTTMLTDAVPLATRARTQGTVDLSIAIAGAGGGLGSGMIVAATDYPGLALLGAALALAIVPALAIAARRHALPR